VTSYRTATLQVVTGSAACAGGMAVLLGFQHGRIGLGGVALVLSWVCFCLVPWAVLPVSIIGGAVAAGLLGQTDVRAIVVARAAAVRRMYGGRHPAARRGRSGSAQLPALPTRDAGGLDGRGNRRPVRARRRQRAERCTESRSTCRGHSDLLPQSRCRRCRGNWRRNARILYVGAMSVLTVLELAPPAGTAACLRSSRCRH
jgi:hypothetical protein